MSALRTPMSSATPQPPSARPLSPGRSPAPSTSKAGSYRPFTALSRDRDRPTSATPRGATMTMTPGYPNDSVPLSSAESPTQQRLQMLQSKLQTQTFRDREIKFAQEKEKESKLVQLDDKLSVLLAGQEAERKRLETDQGVKSTQLEDRIEQLSKQLAQLQGDFESEEQTRKTLNSTFAKNFAIKIEERFIKMEALVSSQKRQLAESEEARVRMLQSVDARMSEIATRFEQERTTRLHRQEEDDRNWKNFQDTLQQLQRSQQDSQKGSAQREENVFGKINAELQALRQQMEQERAVREQEDERKMAMINEGIGFVKDGKDTWLRMFDYKMMPFKMQREEDEAREKDRARQVDGRLADLTSKIELLEGTVEEERRVREDELAVLSNEISKEGKTREATEEQISRLLEHTINRIDDLQQH